MTGISDRSWESMIDRIDLDVSDAELAVAERRLQELAPEELAPVRAEWLEATVAKVRAEAAAAAAPAPVHQLTLLRRVQRFAAAAAAVVGIHSFATAATVATVGVVAVTAVVLWEAGVFSNQTMSFRDALTIQLRSDQPDEDRSAALSQVYRRVQAAMECLLRVRDGSSGTQTLSEQARAGLRAMARQLGDKSDAKIGDVQDTFESSMSIVEDAAVPEPVRIANIALLVDESAVGIAVIVAMPNRSPRIEEDRAAVLRGLLALVSR